MEVPLGMLGHSLAQPGAMKGHVQLSREMLGRKVRLPREVIGV